MSETRLTPARRAELARLCEAATPGPWEAPLVDLGAVESFKALDFYFDHAYEAYPPLGESGPVFVASHESDAAFIAAARTALPEALAESADNERLRAEVDRLTARWEALKAEVTEFANQADHAVSTFYRIGAKAMASRVVEMLTRLEQAP